MESQDFAFEEFLVTEAVGLMFHGFDFVVGAFQGAGGDRVIVVGQDVPATWGRVLANLMSLGNSKTVARSTQLLGWRWRVCQTAARSGEGL